MSLFLQQPEVPAYSDLEYQQHLHDDCWTRQETDHLFDLCKRFSLRFIVINDRWDREKYANRSVEDLKERYYNICNKLLKVKSHIILQDHFYQTFFKIFLTLSQTKKFRLFQTESLQTTILNLMKMKESSPKV